MLSKVDIVRQLFEQSDKKIPMKDLDVLVDKTFSIISDSLSKGEKIQISGFGTFGLTELMTKPLVKIKKVVNDKK
jgi:nucleoid DNA-binding protein